MVIPSGAEPTADARPLVETKVAELLARSPAYQQLSPTQQQELYGHMLNVANYIVQGEALPRSAVIAAPATQLAEPDPVGGVRDAFHAATTPPATPTAGSQYQPTGAVAEQTGTDVLGQAITKVNFPSFVGGLIDGVFKAIVTTSIQQMQAYAEMVKNVSKSVDDFMKDNVSPTAARGYLADKYPDAIEMDTAGPEPKAKVREGIDDSSLPDFFKDLGLSEPLDSLDDETVENTLVPAARRRMALDRQQLLATMILMGINRLVVSDGHIEAACLFELTASDRVTAGSTQTGTMHNEAVHYGEERGGWWFFPGVRDTSTANFDVTTTSTNDSEAKSKLHATLSGKVRVNFRSDVVPLERIADIIQIREMSAKSPAGRQTPSVAAPAAAPATVGAAPAAAAPAAPAR
jgi:hypothetical protein